MTEISIHFTYVHLFLQHFQIDNSHIVGHVLGGFMATCYSAAPTKKCD